MKRRTVRSLRRHITMAASVQTLFTNSQSEGKFLSSSLCMMVRKNVSYPDQRVRSTFTYRFPHVRAEGPSWSRETKSTLILVSSKSFCTNVSFTQLIFSCFPYRMHGSSLICSHQYCGSPDSVAGPGVNDIVLMSIPMQKCNQTLTVLPLYMTFLPHSQRAIQPFVLE